MDQNGLNMSNEEINKIEEKLYAVQDFLYWIEKYAGDLDEKKWTKSQIATIIAKATINFQDETNTAF